MGALLAPNPIFRAWDNNNNPLVGGQLFTYQVGTTTPVATYTDSTAVTANSNPIVLNARGEAPVWLSPTQSYKLVLKDANGNTIWTVDQVTSPAPVAVGNMTDEKGSGGTPGFAANVDFTPNVTTTFTLSQIYGSASNLWVAFDADEQGADTFTLNGKTLTFNAPIPAGINRVYVKGGTALTVGTPSAGSVTDDSIAGGTKLSNRLNDFYDLRDPVYGAKCDGTTDDTAAVQRAINAIGSTSATLIIPGPTLISGALTFSPNTQLFPLNGGYFIGKVGTEVVQLQSAPLAGPVKLLLNMAARATNGMTVYPEWFGAAADGVTDDSTAIQGAINFLKNVGGIVQFEARAYYLSQAVTIGVNSAGSTGQNTVLQGKGRHSTILRTTGATTGTIQVVGFNTTLLQGVQIRELTIDKTVTGTGGIGIFAEYTQGLLLHNIQINNHLYGVQLLGSPNTIAEKVTVTFAGATNNWHGFDLNGGGSNAGGNASSVFRDCYVSAAGATGTGFVGFYAYGAYVSDLQFLSCETLACYIGYEFDMSASANTGNEDVQLINCRADGCLAYGVFVNQAGGSGSADSMVTIIGGWYDMGNVTSTVYMIYLNGCQGVTVSGAQVYNAPAEANAYGIYLNGCQGCKVLGNTLRELKYSIYSLNGRCNMVKGNDMFNAAATPGTQQAVMIGEAYSSLQANVHRGYATNGAVIDGSSTSCSMIDNIADPANISTRYSNSALGTSVTTNNIGA